MLPKRANRPKDINPKTGEPYPPLAMNVEDFITHIRSCFADTADGRHSNMRIISFHVRGYNGMSTQTTQNGVSSGLRATVKQRAAFEEVLAKTIPAGVSILVTHEGKFLASRRSGTETYSGTYQFPGGSVDPGEKAVDAAVRELSEEVGLDLDSSWLKPRGMRRFTRADGSTYNLYCFTVNVRPDKVKEIRNREPDKQEDLRWYRPEEVLDKEKMIPGMEDILRSHYRL